MPTSNSTMVVVFWAEPAGSAAAIAFALVVAASRIDLGIHLPERRARRPRGWCVRSRGRSVLAAARNRTARRKEGGA